jgi:hypothetical protein
MAGIGARPIIPIRGCANATRYFVSAAREDTMVTIDKELQAKIERVHAARMQVETYVADGGDLKSIEAMPIGLELLRACDELCKEFAPEVLDERKGGITALLPNAYGVTRAGEPDAESTARIERLDGKAGEAVAPDGALAAPGVD